MKHYRWSTVDPIIYYDKILGNFIHNIEVFAYNNANLIEYKIKDYDTPENICLRLYNDSSLAWILLYMNDIIDPFYDWPLNNGELRKYMVSKYGSEHLGDIHHYVMNGKVVNRQTGAVPVTNEEYEITVNDNKRNILIPTTELMTAFINNMEAMNNE
ncbi:baseplate wedge protein 53 [bacterium]|nr:baseplate wedge protein 53 [bacterium]